MDINGFKFRMKTFLWYLATEPFRQIASFFVKSYRDVGRRESVINIYMILFIIFALVGNKLYMICLGILFMISWIQYEWDRGYYVHVWRKHREKKYKNKTGGEA